jgi:hypothetical protein
MAVLTWAWFDGPVTFVIEAIPIESAKIHRGAGRGRLCAVSGMEVLTAKTVRRSTRVRVEFPVSVISLDRQRPFGDRCLVLVVSAQGCGFRSSEELQAGTPIMISDLPGGGSVTAHVANCIPMGSDGKYWLVGASLYTQGNVWGIANPPADWNVAAANDPKRGTATPAAEPGKAAAANVNANKKAWPYNLFSEGAEAPLRRR